MEQLYSAGPGSDAATSDDGATGGCLVLAFLPEKSEEDDDDVEVEEDEDEDEGDDATKAECVAYMQSFMAKSSRTIPRSAHLLRRKTATASPKWDRALLRHGLECRTQAGGCKLRFVWCSEDLWYANNPPRTKRTRARAGGSAAKRQKLAGLMSRKLGKDSGPNALTGQPPATQAPLPRMHTLKPLAEPSS